MTTSVQYPLLEKLEAEHLSLLQERFNILSTRRREEDEDDLSTVFGHQPASATSNPDQVDTEVNSVERNAARAARRQEREKNRNVNEGYSTDSELLPSDESAYRTALAGLTSRAKQVLSDVHAPEFRDPGKGNWRIWREKYSDSYVGAWGGLGVVSVWEFWARLECVGWDCIEVCIIRSQVMLLG